MAIPVLQSSTNFSADEESVSAIWNQGQLATRRMISCTIPELPSPTPGRLAGWLWGDVRNDLNTFVRFATIEVLFASETAIYLPAEFTGVVWRLSFFPVEKLTPRTGVFRYYTI